MAGHDVDLPAPRRSQLRRRLREIDPDELAGRLRHRARRQLCFAHPAALAALADDGRLIRSGWAAADRLGLGVVSGGDEPLEGYLAEQDLAAVRSEHGLIEASEVANIVLRVIQDQVVVPHADGIAAEPVVGLDLLESGDPRGVSVGRQLLAQALEAADGR